MDDIVYVKVTDEAIEPVYTIETEEGLLEDTDEGVIEAEL